MQSREESPGLGIYLAIGLVEGIVGWLCTDFWPEALVGRVFCLALLSFVLVTGLGLQFLLDRGVGRQEKVFLIGLGLLFAAISGWVVAEISWAGKYGDTELGFSWALASLGLAYVIFPFLQACSARIGWRYTYADLYRHSWDNFFIVVVAGFLTLAYWLLIVLWAMLFGLVDIKFFEDIFFTLPFAWLTLPLVFSLGMRIGVIHNLIINTLREIVLSLCRYLMPMAALISVLFALALLFTGLESIWDTGHSTPILLCLIGANIFLVNGVFQAGTEPKPYYNQILTRLVELSLLLLPVFSMIAVYSLWLRIDQYGLLPARIYSGAFILVALGFSLVYSIAVFIKRDGVWLGFIKQGNIMLALVIIGITILLHTPLFAPQMLSAKNQLHRILSQQVAVEAFDFGALKFKLGRYGTQALEKLAQLKDDHPLKKAVEPRLAQVGKAEFYYAFDENDFVKVTLNLMIVANKWLETVPENFEEALPNQQCRGQDCYLLPVDLNNDQQPELLLIEGERTYGPLQFYLKTKSGSWELAGDIGQNISRGERKDMIQNIKKGNFEIVQPHYRSLKIGETVLEPNS